MDAVAETAKKHGINDRTICLRRWQFDKLDLEDGEWLRVRDQENGKFKKLVAERDLAINVIRKVV